MGDRFPARRRAAQAFVHVGPARSPPSGWRRSPRVAGRCHADANGDVGVTGSRPLLLTATDPTKTRLHLNGCLKTLYHRLRRDQTLVVEVPVSLSGVKKSDTESTGADALLQRVVTIARERRR
jgi:hypothetical protein